MTTIGPAVSAEHSRLALVALWPDRPQIILDGPGAIPDEERALLGRTAQAIADGEVRGYGRGYERAEATVPGADRGALVDLLGALERLGLESLHDDESEPVSYAPATVLALRDAVRRANRRIDRTPT